MKKAIFATLMMCLMLAAAGTASAQTSHFHGHWKNVDAQTRGLVELDIKVHGLDVDVKAWGACSPTPCDVGKTDAHIYAAGVNGNLETTAKALLVTYREKFAVRTLVIEEHGRDEISVAMFTHFTDNSGRSPYVEYGIFKR